MRGVGQGSFIDLDQNVSERKTTSQLWRKEKSSHLFKREFRPRIFQKITEESPGPLPPVEPAAPQEERGLAGEAVRGRFPKSL